MTEERAVTIVVPMYNGARFLAAALRSLLEQTFADYAILCVDDASTDDSVAVAGSFSGDRLHVLRNERRLGLAGNWNRAFALATTPYLVIAHQDDVYDRQYLSAVLALLVSHPQAFIAHTGARYVDDSGTAIDSAAASYKQSFWPRDEPYERPAAEELRILQRGNYLACPSVIYRMSAVQRLGPFNEELQFVTDWEYWIRGLSAGFTIAGSREQLVSLRRHTASATAEAESSLRRYDEELALLTSMAGKGGLPLRFEALEHTLLSDFTSRLAGGDRPGAISLRDYARRTSVLSRRVLAIMNLGLAGGRAVGHALRLAESLYVQAAGRFRRR